jgi:DNA invertase Pin-like site-specific DNA recombinase
MKCYGYGRHSTAKQSATEDVQRAAVESYFTQSLRQKGATWAGFHYDAATSGGMNFSDRPEGLRVWVLLQPGDYVVVSKLDRAFRSLIDGARTMELLKQKRVHFVALDVGIDTGSPMGEFALNVFLAAAQLQRRYAAERTSEVLRHKSAMGVPIGGAATSSPYGWRRVGRGKKSYLVIDEGERQRIEHLARLRETGLSLERVCVATSLAEHRWVNEGRRWYPTSVSAALRARAKGYPKVFMRSSRGGKSARQL